MKTEYVTGTIDEITRKAQDVVTANNAVWERLVNVQVTELDNQSVTLEMKFNFVADPASMRHQVISMNFMCGRLDLDDMLAISNRLLPRHDLSAMFIHKGKREIYVLVYEEKQP